MKGAVCLWNLAILCWALGMVTVDAWSGNYYQIGEETTYTYRRECCRHFLWWCTSHCTMATAHRRPVFGCCPGWTTSGYQQCNRPVCNPPCQNGGTCIAGGSCSTRNGFCRCPAHRCNCPYQYTGSACSGETCSHQSPCYPGTCTSGTHCQCATGFTTTSNSRTNRCLKLDYRQGADLRIDEMRVRMSYWPRDAHPQVERFWMMADSTNLQNDIGFMWTRHRDFNRLETTCSSQYYVRSLPGTPDYVQDASLGIALGEMDIWLSKLNPNGGRFDSVKNATLQCPHHVSASQPAHGLYNCNIVDPNFDRLLEHGDILRVTFKTRGGGYRNLFNINTNRVATTQYFTGDIRENSVEFRFDFHNPTHCAETRSCSGGEVPLSVPDIATAADVQIHWNGWLDVDSGMDAYSVEVMKMTKAFTGTLQITQGDLLHPVEYRQVSGSQLATQIFTPPAPGLYTVLLGASDAANNTKYTRRLLLYDPISTITIDANNDLYVSSASAAANYSYQSDVSAPVVVTWRDHFVNNFLEENKLLGEVLTFPLQQDFPDKAVDHSSPLDDHDGARTVDAVRNSRGIVNFKLTWKRDSSGGQIQPQTPPSLVTWVDLYLNSTFTLPDSASEGTTFTVWVKARDFTGHERTDRTQVHFDQSSPSIQDFDFVMNSPADNINFPSKVQLTVTDQQSGVAYITWTFRRQNGSLLYQHTVPGISESYETCRGQFTRCSCTPSHSCFPFDQSFAFSNCHVIVGKDQLATESVIVTADVTNMAGLVTNRILKISNLQALNGTRAYFPPQNLTIIEVTDSSVTLTWTFPPSCFRREEVYVMVEGERRPVGPDTEVYGLTGLEPETTYTIAMMTLYDGEEMSDEVTLVVITAAAPDVSISAGALAGVIIAVFIITFLVLFVVVFVLWRKGFLLQKPGRIHNQLRRVNSIYGAVIGVHSEKRLESRKNMAAFHNNAYREADREKMEDVYVYRDMTFETPQSWELRQDSLTLLDLVANGKFADVYKCQCARPGQPAAQKQVVAAKMLKPDYSEDDELKMRAQIDFYVTNQEKHENVLHFIGAVMDSKNWGPVIVLELCERGQMDRWLVKHRDDTGAHTLDNLRQFALGVAEGMAFLASKQILHGRLAARNVLLTKALVAKVAGFGPRCKPGDEKKQTRIPAKWSAPEVLLDQPPTEKSDVWSFGVVLWEIFSMGQVPYPNIHAKEIGARLKGGYRMEKPELADAMIYEVMMACWKEDPNQRPTFNTLRGQVGRNSVALASKSAYYEPVQLRG